MAIGAALALVGFSKLQWPVRIVILYIALVMMVGVVYSASRGSWLALAASVIALVVWGNADDKLREAWNALASALAELADGAITPPPHP